MKKRTVIYLGLALIVATFFVGNNSSYAGEIDSKVELIKRNSGEVLQKKADKFQSSEADAIFLESRRLLGDDREVLKPNPKKLTDYESVSAFENFYRKFIKIDYWDTVRYWLYIPVDPNSIEEAYPKVD